MKTKIKFKDLYKLIEDGDLLSITVDHCVYYEDGTIYSYVNQGDIVVEKREKNEKFEEFCKKYFDYYVTSIFSGIDGGVCVELKEEK